MGLAAQVNDQDVIDDKISGTSWAVVRIAKRTRRASTMVSDPMVIDLS